MFGWLIHFLVDAALVSVSLAGIRRSSGLTFRIASIPSKDVRNLMRVYLETGECIFDFTATIMARTSYFERVIK